MIWIQLAFTPIIVALGFAYVRMIASLIKDREWWMAAFMACVFPLIPALLGVIWIYLPRIAR